MGTQSLRSPEVLARLDKLEKENARLKRIALLVLLVAGALVLMGQAKQGSTPWQKQVLRVGTVQAKTIEVLQERSDPYAEFGPPIPPAAQTQNAAAAKGFSPTPTVAVRISGSSLGPELIMFDENGKARVSLNGSLGVLQMGELQSDNTGHVGLANPGSTVLLSGSGGGGILVLKDKTGKQTADLSASDSGPVLNLISDHPRLFVGRNDGYSTAIGSQEVVSSGKTYTTSAAAIFLFDEKGHSIWSAEQTLPMLNYIDTQTRTLQLSVDNSKRDLDDFKEAVCPFLRRADLGWQTRIKVDSACSLH